MHPFKYEVSLRIWHPNIAAAVVNETIPLPSHPVARGTGEYWRHRYDVPLNGGCSQFVHCAAIALERHAGFLQRVRSLGGRAEFFIGWFGDQNFGDTFPSATLSLLGQLGIDLAFDVYPEAPKTT